MSLLARQICLAMACLLPVAATIAEEDRPGPTQRRLQRLLDDPGSPLCLSSDLRSGYGRFQFEFRLGAWETEDRTFSLRVVVQREWDALGALMLTPRGVPISHFAEDWCLQINPAEPTTLFKLPGRFQLPKTGAPISQQGIDLGYGVTESQVHVDLRALIEDMRRHSKVRDVDERTSTLTYESENTTSQIRLNREKGPSRFPIASLRITLRDGRWLGYTNFYVDGMAPRDIYRLGTPPATMHVSPIDVYKDEDLWAKPLLLSLGQYQHIMRFDREEPLRAAGLKFLGSLPPKRGFSPEQRRRLGDLLDALDGRTEPHPDPSEWMTTFEEFMQLLGKETFRRAVARERNPAVSLFDDRVYIVGYDRRRSAHFLEVRGGPLLAARVYDVLGEIVRNPPHGDPAERIAGLEVVAALGLPEESTLLDEIESALATDTDPWVRTFLAVARAGTGTPTDGDIARLRAAVEDAKAIPRYRYVCLEALLRLNEADGLASEMLQLIAEWSAGDSYAMRCLLSAGCSKEGRDMLLRLVTDRYEHPPVLTSLSLLHSSVQPGDHHWEPFLSLAKELALDKDQDVTTRRGAAAMAAADRTDRDFRDKLVRKALRFSDMMFLKYAGKHYFQIDRSADQYAEEFGRRLMESSDTWTRSEVARIFVTGCPVRLALEGRDDVVKVIESILGDPQRRVRLHALDLLRQSKRAGGKVPLRLLSAIVNAGRHEWDARASLAMLLIVSELTDGNFRFDYPDIGDGKLGTDRETLTWIRQNRRRLELEALRWLKTQQEELESNE